MPTPGADTINFNNLAGSPDLYTLTIPGSLEDAAATGDLDITGTVTILGNGPSETIIQAGTNNTNGIDKVFSVNQTATSNASATFNGVTVRFGRNTNPNDQVNFSHLGAGIDMFGPSGTCSEKLTVINSVITDNTVANGVSPGVGAGLSPDNASVEITNSTISNNKTTNQFGGGISHTGNSCTFTMTNSIVSGNEAHGGSNGEGGGIFIRQNVNGTVMIHSSTISNNTSESRAGGIKLEAQGTLNATIDQETRITGNTSSGAGTGISEGGGVDISTNGGTTTLTDVTITNNHADDPADSGGKGGGIFLNLGNLNVSLSRITGNTAPMGSGLFRATAAGTATAQNNWWGCDDFPNATGCDTVDGTASVNPRLDLVVTATPSTINSGGTSSVKADVSKNSAGAAVTPVVLNGLPITFGATHGTMSPPSAPLASFMATSTYTNTSCPTGPETVMATLDNGIGTAGITIDCNSDLAVTKSDAPDPVVAGDNITYTINFSNGGPSNALNTTVTDAVPANTTFVSASVTTGTGWSIAAPTVGGTGNVVFSKASGETAVFHIVVKVNAGTSSGATINNTATVTSTTPDPNSGNNSAQASTTVNPAPALLCNGLTPTIVGTSGNNTINGTNGNDVIHGLGGNDVINGGNGDDVICGGDDNDTLNGGNGKDRLFGENGNDALNGNNGDDALDGGANTDTCNGGNGSDTAAACETVTGVP